MYFERLHLKHPTKGRGASLSTALFFNLFFKKKSGASTTDNRGCMLPLRTNVLSIVKILYHLQAMLARTFFILLSIPLFVLPFVQLLLFSRSLSPSLIKAPLLPLICKSDDFFQAESARISQSRSAHPGAKS